MKRVALSLMLCLIVSPILAASKPLVPGQYVVPPCPPVVTCPPDTVCPAIEPCPTCPPSPVTATTAALPECLWPVQPLTPGGDLRLGAADPVAASARPARTWYKDWRFWAAAGGGLILGAVIEHSHQDEDHGGTKHTTDYIPVPSPVSEPCWPPGHCRH